MTRKTCEAMSMTEEQATWIPAFDIFPCWCSNLHSSPRYISREGSDDTHDTMISNDGIESGGNCQSQDVSEETQREKDEVLGWTLDASARGVAVMGTAVFVSSDILRLAKAAAGCVDAEEECTGRIYGMRPSSVLANIVMVVGLLSAFLMPLIGSIIDHTKYRREVGSFSAGFMSFTILLQMVVLEDFWLLAAFLQVVVAFSYTVHLCSVYAYLPELTSDHEKLTQYATRFSAAQYTGSVVFLLLMVGILTTMNQNDKYRSSLLSQSVVFLICTLFFGYAWLRLFRSRPASQKVPANKTLLSAGFWKIYKTSQTILLHHSAIKWFLVSASCTQAATTTFSTIAITYMTEQLGFSARENGIAILILLLFGVPGTQIASKLAKAFNPIRSLQANLVFWTCSIFFASMFLTKPGQQYTAYFFAMLWGLSLGWVYPTEKTLYVTIIPRGQEAELMGTYICCCQVLSWLPPLLFSVMNEMGFSMRIGLSSLIVFFSISFCILFFVGDYNEAVAHAKAIDKGSIPFTVGPKEDMGAAIGHCYEQFAEDAVCNPGIISDTESGELETIGDSSRSC